MGKDSRFTSVHYGSYLQLEKILDAQKLRSVEVEGKVAHDEMLFIIVHQVYELWFKQINFELDDVFDFFEGNKVDEKNVGIAVHRLSRVAEIFKLLIQQIRVLETMTPLDFLDFRSYLFPASGFQSFQFRKMELMMGLKKQQRHSPYLQVFDKEKQATLQKLENGKSLLQHVERWLERTPFLEFRDFNFLEQYKKAVQNMLAREKSSIRESDILSEKYKEMRYKMLGDTDTYFSVVLDPQHHNALKEKGEVQLSYKAMVAALLINLYRDEPILHQPFHLLASLMDIDELLTTWRYRHAHMVLRMLGRKVGTGGSSGHAYLRKTAEQHSVFGDLYNISTLLIPRSELPELPSDLRRSLGFYFTAQ